MKPWLVVSGVLKCFLVLPIWFYLIYCCVAAAHPDRLLWFLFWTYCPVSFMTTMIGVIGEVIESRQQKKSAEKK